MLEVSLRKIQVMAKKASTAAAEPKTAPKVKTIKPIGDPDTWVTIQLTKEGELTRAMDTGNGVIVRTSSSTTESTVYIPNVGIYEGKSGLYVGKPRQR
jgi:hypothetical protein